MATKTTVTEGLAEIKTINARLVKKREAVLQHIGRDKALRDPMERTGGQQKFVAEELQGIRDLEQRIVKIRLAIQAANQTRTMKVGDVEKSVAEWLNWRREIATGSKAFLAQVMARIVGLQDQAIKKGYKVTQQETTQADERELVINVDVAGLYGTIEAMEKTLGDLDGQLSLFNATATIEIAN